MHFRYWWHFKTIIYFSLEELLYSSFLLPCIYSSISSAPVHNLKKDLGHITSCTMTGEIILYDIVVAWTKYSNFTHFMFHSFVESLVLCVCVCARARVHTHVCVSAIIFYQEVVKQYGFLSIVIFFIYSFKYLQNISRSVVEKLTNVHELFHPAFLPIEHTGWDY